VIVGYLRGLRVLLGPLRDQEVVREPAISSTLIAAMLLVCLSLSVKPQLLANLVSIVTGALATVAEVPLQ
jgi:hypothetical protein